MVGELMHPQDYFRTLWKTMFNTIAEKYGHETARHCLQNVISHLLKHHDQLQGLINGSRAAVFHMFNDDCIFWVIKTGTKQEKP